MAIAFRSQSHLTPGSSTSPTIGEPAGAASGDLLISLVAVDSPGGTPTPPAGWTTINSGSSTNGHFNYFLQYIVRGASAPNLTTTFTGNNYREWGIACYQGVDTTTPIDSRGTEVKTGGTNTGPDPPSTTAVSSAAMAIAVGLSWNGAPGTGWTAPTGYTRQIGAATDGIVICLMEKQLAASGAEDPGIFVGTATATDDKWAQTITLAPVGGGGGGAAIPDLTMDPYQGAY